MTLLVKDDHSKFGLEYTFGLPNVARVRSSSLDDKIRPQ